MGTVTAGTIIDRCARQLFDVNGVKWPRTDLLEWLNVGQRLIVVLQPSSSNTVAVIKLAVGSRQSIPSTGWSLLDVIRNMGTTGTTPGRAVRIASRRLMDAFNPLWHSATASAVTQNFVFDPQDQTAFFVYPPSNGQGYVEINYASLPAMISSEASAISVPDAYEDALVNYVMFRALSKYVEYADSDEAQRYLSMFNGFLGAKVSAEQANNPNIGLAPPNPAVEGGVS